MALATLMCAVGVQRGARAQPAWQASLEAFDEADRVRPPPHGGVVFVGSSSVRLWPGLEQAFGPEHPVIARGFGGALLADCADHVERLVLRHRPRLVLLYAGENDLAAGHAPEQVLHSFERLVRAVHAALPEARIAFLSIKPSPLRAVLLPQVRQANALVRARVERDARLHYVDVHARMLGPDGQPQAALFQPDGLHLNERGYALWRTVLTPLLR